MTYKQPSHTEIIHAYRNIYKHLLRAVQYSKPARFVAQDRVRNAFRKSQPADFDRARFDRTLEFLHGAAKAKGLEHKLVKNLMHVWWEQKKLVGARVPQSYVVVSLYAFAEPD